MSLVEVRMLDSGPNGNHEPGRVLAVDAARAAALVEGGHAEPADAPRQITNYEGLDGEAVTGAPDLGEPAGEPPAARKRKR